MEGDGLFWIGGRKVVLRMVFWGVFGVEYQRESVTVRDVVSEINVNDYYIMSYRVCVTLVTAKNIKLLYCARTRTYNAIL